jgi:hypothetical protein
MLIPMTIVAGVLLGMAAFGLAQQKPDFSGEWILNRQASSLSPGADAMQSGVVQIEHRDPTFRYKAAFVSTDGPLQYEFELKSAPEVVGAQQEGTPAASLQWDGEALVANFHVQRPDGDLKISFRYELIDAGQRLRAVEELRGSGREQDNTWIFDRR